MALSIGELSLAHFADLPGAKFRVDGVGSEPVLLELISASALAGPGRRGGLRREPFSLLFRGPMTPFLPQQIHRFEHEGLGALEIFIVPIGPDEQGHIYEAIFT